MQAPGKVAGENGSIARYEVQNYLSWISSELHGSIGNLFGPLNEEMKAFFKEKTCKKIDYLEKRVLPGKKFLVGDGFTIADSYLYIVLSWHASVGIDLSAYPLTQAYYNEIKGLEKIEAAHKLMANSPVSTA